MPDTYIVAPDALEILKAKEEPVPLREFIVPFVIEGQIKVRATDIEGARYLSEHISQETYAQHGTLETFEPEQIQ